MDSWGDNRWLLSSGLLKILKSCLGNILGAFLILSPANTKNIININPDEFYPLEREKKINKENTKQNWQLHRQRTNYVCAMKYYVVGLIKIALLRMPMPKGLCPPPLRWGDIISNTLHFFGVMW